MPENLYLPTLSPEGWVQSTSEQADYLISHFFTSEYSQTHLYRDNVSSFQYVIQMSQGDMDKTTSMVRTTLILYFSKYFTNVTVECTYKQVPTNSSSVQLDIYVSFVDKDGKEFILGRVLELKNSKIIKIANINNTGVV